jgi:hypothetical protein
MDASLETLVTAAHMFACALSIPRCGPRDKATDQELIALAVAQAVTGLVSDRQFLGESDNHSVMSSSEPKPTTPTAREWTPAAAHGETAQTR